VRVGVVRELKDNENRVGLTPDGAGALASDGHEVLVERGAGAGSGFTDAEYAALGAHLVGQAQAWGTDLVVKVKEPLASEHRYLGGQILFAYLHLAGIERATTEALLEAGTTAVAYETVEDAAGRLPLLEPMSAIAGNMAPVVGAYYLARPHGGRGVQLGTVLGERHGRVLVLGDGVVGTHAARVADALGAQVAIAGRHPDRLPRLQAEVSPRLSFLPSTPEGLAAELPQVDLLVGAVLQRGARAPRLVSEAMVKTMPAGSVVVDVSIDQGGCVETSHATTHSDPVYRVHGVLHYGVTNMPGAYPRTATQALTAATLPYTRRLAAGGLAALAADPGFGRGVNTHAGHVTCEAVAEALGLRDRYRPFPLNGGGPVRA
jgi:alanine dehydrogenase